MLNREPSLLFRRIFKNVIQIWRVFSNTAANLIFLIFLFLFNFETILFLFLLYKHNLLESMTYARWKIYNCVNLYFVSKMIQFWVKIFPRGIFYKI